ncbi:MAG: serine/threonine-protein kinase [Thermoguttaceae bacterium]|jgi:serine/threonine protein kinase
MPNQPKPSMKDEEWICLNETIRGLEECRRSGAEPDLSRWLPNADSPFRRRTLVELIKIDQEHRYRAARPRLLESYLDGWPELSADAELLAELLEAECMTRMAIGEIPTREELATRFPEIADRIDLDEIAAQVEREGGTAVAEIAAGRDSRGAAESQSAPERYQIRAVLGRGAMGTVYRAYDTQLERQVALKIPSSDLGKDPRVWNRLFSEARAVASIQHRNVCPVFDVGQSHGRYYIAMALVQGESLAARLQRGCLDCRQAATLAWKLAGALATVHAAGIIHRDVKPQNVMLDAEGEPLLTDFGLARPVHIDGGAAGADSLSGTPAYMSPEQVRGEPVTAASDVYALGVVLYQMLSGRLPFGGRLPQLASRILQDKPTRPSDFRSKVDRVLESICLKAMEKRPADRFRSARELENALSAYLRSTVQIGRYSRIRSSAVNVVSYLYLPPLSAARWLRLMAGRMMVVAVALAALVLVAYLALRAMPGSGVMVLEISPPDAVVSIDGSVQTIKPPRDAIILPAGQHQLTVSKQGFQAESRRFSTRKGEKTELILSLTREQSQK